MKMGVKSFGGVRWVTGILCFLRKNSGFVLFLFLAIHSGRTEGSSLIQCPKTLKVCPKISDTPACSSLGHIYTSECDLQRRNCGNDVKSVNLNFCTRSSGSMCYNKCNNETDYQCGSDGHTYMNRCWQQVGICMYGITLAHPGPCMNLTATRENCPIRCEYAPKDGPICGSDGNVYKSTCEMKLLTCGQGVVRTHLRRCQTTKHCEDKCWRISKATCGSDGVLYKDYCSMKKKNCGRHIFEVPMTNCLKKSQRSIWGCPDNCANEPYRPICGNDGNLYDNECELKYINCKYKVQNISMHYCYEKAEKCKIIRCDNNHDPVCGNDGRTYRNWCLLQLATCRKGTILSHWGGCSNRTEFEGCEKLVCPENKDEKYVCGSDGNVYRSSCALQKETCGQRVVKVPLERCQTTRFCNTVCKSQREFVCGSDLKFYKNECELRSHNCGKHVYVVPLTKCLTNFKFANCRRLCPNIYNPICGADNKTYSNDCFLEMENCRLAQEYRPQIRKLYSGKCGQPVKEVKNYVY